MIANLISNAIKFTEKGSVQVGADLVVREGRDLVRVWVKDTGIGIPEEGLNRLFKSFSQVDPSTNRRYGGTGLGLAISKQLVELMGGDLQVESQAGRGSTFEFTFAVRISSSAPQPRRVMSGPARTDLRILVVEDNPINRTVIEHMLAKLGYTADVVWRWSFGRGAVLAHDVRPDSDGRTDAGHRRNGGDAAHPRALRA